MSRVTGRPRAGSIAVLTLAAMSILSIAGQAQASRSAPVRLAIDPQRSEVVFHMQTTWHGVEGRTNNLKGAITSDGPDPLVDGRVSVEIDAASLDTGNRRRDKTMREDYLETAKHPTILFVSTGQPETTPGVVGQPDVAFTLPGDLTIHGVTRRVSLPAKARQEGGAWVVRGELPVRLSDFAIPDPSMLLNRVQDVVTVSFTVVATPESGSRD